MSRRGDKEEKTYFRSDRLFCSNGQWFFATREGEQGPFGSRDLARAALERFIGEKQGLHEFQSKREATKNDSTRLTTIAKRLDKRGELVEVRKFDDNADFLI